MLFQFHLKFDLNWKPSPVLVLSLAIHWRLTLFVGLHLRLIDTFWIGLDWAFWTNPNGSDTLSRPLLLVQWLRHDCFELLGLLITANLRCSAHNLSCHQIRIHLYHHSITQTASHSICSFLVSKYLKLASMCHKSQTCHQANMPFINFWTLMILVVHSIHKVF